MRDLIGAVLAASPAEFAEVTSAKRRRPQPARAGSATAASARPSARGAVLSQPEPGNTRRVSVTPNSPFDITSPSELLASTTAAPSTPELSSDRIDELAAAAAPARDSSPVSTPPSSPTPAPRAPSLLGETKPRTATPPGSAEGEGEAESERRPRIVLREGEQILAATGSGVVIRRARAQTAGR